MPTVLGSDGAIPSFRSRRTSCGLNTIALAAATGSGPFFSRFKPRPAGSAVVPFRETSEGSTVFLPFQANQIYLLDGRSRRSPNGPGKLNGATATKPEKTRSRGRRLRLLGWFAASALGQKGLHPRTRRGAVFSVRAILRSGRAQGQIHPALSRNDLQATDAPAVKVIGAMPRRIYQLFVRRWQRQRKSKQNGVGRKRCRKVQRH
jgi:hypothetical protein